MEISGVLYADNSTYFDPVYTPDVVFAQRETGNLTLQLLTPVGIESEREESRDPYKREQHRSSPPRPKEERRFPLLVCVPGSGWGGADGHILVPKMARFARAGYAVASISYRGTYKDDVRFPAAVQDTKEAIRFLRAHAATYHLDTERVALLGDSSGGHTVAMAALTGDEPRFNIGEHLDQPTAVKACVIYYGPNDLTNLVADRLAEKKTLRPGEGEVPFEAHEIFQEEYRKDPEAMLADASPINYINAEKKLPAFLFLSGDADPIIPLRQGIRFCEKVRACGGSAEFFKINHGGHGTGCWTREAMALIERFLVASV